MHCLWINAYQLDFFSKSLQMKTVKIITGIELSETALHILSSAIPTLPVAEPGLL